MKHWLLGHHKMFHPETLDMLDGAGAKVGKAHWIEEQSTWCWQAPDTVITVTASAPGFMVGPITLQAGDIWMLKGPIIIEVAGS